MSTKSILKLIYNKNNNKKSTIKNALNTYKINNIKKNYIKSKKIKKMPKIKISNETNKENTYIFMITSKNTKQNKKNDNDTNNNNINWLVIIDKDNDKNEETVLIPYYIQSKTGIYEFTLTLYSLDKLDISKRQTFVSDIKNSISKRNAFLSKNKIDRVKSFENINKLYIKTGLTNLIPNDEQKFNVDLTDYVLVASKLLETTFKALQLFVH
jgi:hypothetical protein